MHAHTHTHTHSRLLIIHVRIIRFTDYLCGLFVHFYRLGNHAFEALSEFGSCF